MVWSSAFRRSSKLDKSRLEGGTPNGNRQMKYKALLALLLLSSLVFIGPACNRASYGADDKSKIHVGIVFDIGGKDDRSFNAAAWAGVKCAESGTLPDGRTSCGKPET